MAPKTAEADWRQFLTQGNPGLQRLRGWFRRVPQDPRCVSCCVPFEGPMAPLFRAFGFKRFDKNPRWCSNCFNHLDKRQRGGAVVEISMLFADVRGSTAGLSLHRSRGRQAIGSGKRRTAVHQVLTLVPPFLALPARRVPIRPSGCSSGAYELRTR